MSPDLCFALSLIVKMVVTAAFLLAATITAERAGPLIGGLVATLPISAGPVYIFLALDHDAHFIAQSALGSLVTNAYNTIFAVVYALLAQSHSLVVSFGIAIAVWTVLTFAGGNVAWTVSLAVIFNIVVIGLALWISAPLRHAPMPRVQRRWYDLVLRAAIVALLVGTVVTLSFRIGPTASGNLAVFPHRAKQHHVHPASSRRRAGDRSRHGERGDRAWRFCRRGACGQSHRGTAGFGACAEFGVVRFRVRQSADLFRATADGQATSAALADPAF